MSVLKRGKVKDIKIYWLFSSSQRIYKRVIQCDLNVNNLTGLRNTWLLNAYSAKSKPIQEARVKPLAMFIKKIAKKCEVNNPMNGTLSRLVKYHLYY